MQGTTQKGFFMVRALHKKMSKNSSPACTDKSLTASVSATSNRSATWEGERMDSTVVGCSEAFSLEKLLA